MMKKNPYMKFFFAILILTLTACGPAVETVPVEPTLPIPEATATLTPLPSSTPEPTQAPLPTSTSEPTTSFEATTYRDEAAGFELDYPANWALDDGEKHSRGYYVQFYSWGWQPGDMVESIPEGETVLSVVVNQWDPKNDLEAFIDQRKLGWDSSGTALLSEERITLNGDWPAAQFTVRGPDGLSTFILFTTIGDQYLTLSGNGDLAKLAEIAHTLRRIQ